MRVADSTHTTRVEHATQLEQFSTTGRWTD